MVHFVLEEAPPCRQAITSFTQAIEVNPENTDAYMQRGRANKELKEYDKAIQDYTTALDLDPEEEAAYAGRGNAYECIQGTPP
jgi:tetratricopeptide (TPR) repeat protein